MKKYFLLVLFGVSVFFVNAQYTWVNKSLFPDSGFLEGAAFAINGMGYIVGGSIDNNNGFSYHTWQYDPVAQTWTQKANYPHKTAGGAFFSINGIGYQIGGSDTTGYYESDNNAYDPVANTWVSKAPYPENGVGGGYYFVINGIAYVGGGVRNTSEHGVVSGYAYNPANDTWSSIADFPYPAIGLCTFAIDSFGYAGVGGDGNGNFFNSMYKYSPSSNTWSPVAPFPGKGRFVNHSSFVVGRKGYVGAGETVSSQGGAYCFGDYYAYDPATDTWAAAPGLQGPPRHAPNTISFGDSAFLVGGYNQDGEIFYRFVDEFKPVGVVCSVTDTTHFYDTTHISVTDTLYITVSVGIIPNNTNNTMLVYPNPAHTQLLINTGNYASMSGYSLKMMNPLGQTVFQNADNQQLFTINISTWAAGIYYLQVIDPSSMVVAIKEIVIQ